MLTMKAASMVARGARPTALPRVIPKVNICVLCLWFPFQAGTQKGVFSPCFLMNFVHLQTLLLRLACSDQWPAQRWMSTKTCSSRNGMVCWLSDIVDENVFFFACILCVKSISWMPFTWSFDSTHLYLAWLFDDCRKTRDLRKIFRI